jgi:hypothetical protein
MGVQNITTGQKLLSILTEEIKRVGEAQAARPLNGGEIANLERLTKMYHILMTEDRDSQKALGGLSEKELSELAGEEPDSGTDTAE